MSLQVWLPLNGNLNNQGIINLNNINNNSIVNNNGKIGKCYEFTPNQRFKGQFPVVINSPIGTICGWFKFKSMPSSGNWGNLIQIGNDGGFATSLLSLYLWANDKLCFCIRGYDCSNSGCTTVYNHTMVINQWYHIAASYDGTLAKIYINGEEVLSATPQLGSYTTGTYFYIGGTNNYYLNGFINDVRYYNNALTADEIKEISKALILHYPLSGAPESNLHNLPSGLPNEYQEIEYIESTGAQYINTEYCYTTDTKISIIFTPVKVGSNAWIPICGVRDVNTSKFSYWIHGDLQQTAMEYSSGTAFGINHGNYQYKQQFWTNDIGKFIVNGINEGDTISTSLSTTTHPLYLFALRSGSNLDNRNAYLQIKSFKCQNSTGLTVNMVPCFRKSDGKPGMYDTVRNTFYTNSGSGEFICGPAVTIWPEEYIPLESISNNDLPSEIINTGVIPTATIGSIIKAKCDNIVQGAERIFYGSSTNGGYISGQNHCIEWTRNLSIGGAFANQYYIDNTDLAESKTHIISLNFNGNKKMIIDGIEKFTFSSSFSSSTSPIYIFGRSVNSAKDSTTYNAQSSFYYIQIYDGTKLIRDYRPALQISDNKPGLLELISKTFITNSSSNLLKYSTNLDNDISGLKYMGNLYDKTNNLLKTSQAIRYNKYLHIDGNLNHYIDLSSFNMPAFTEMSFMLWFKCTSATTNNNWHVTMAGPNTWIEISINVNKTVRVGINGSSEKNLDTTVANILDGNWHFIVGTWDGATIKQYVDGALTTSSSANGITFTGQVTNLTIGKYSSNYTVNNGSLSDARIYATALNDNDIQELYNMGRLS